jgi:hypothetical protein
MNIPILTAAGILMIGKSKRVLAGAGFLAATLSLCALAQSQPAALPAGTWIAIDDGFPGLVAAGVLLPTEEILHVSPDGRAESRLMTITALETHYMCATGWGCSDMLPVWEAKAELTGGNLVFRNREATTEGAKVTREEQRLAAGLTLIATSSHWVASFEAGGNRLRLETGAMTRVFARIDPERMNRLRGALLPLAISYGTHWRCFMSNATAADPALDAIGGPRRAPGAWFEDYLAAAAELHRLDIINQTPTADDELAKSMPDLAKAATMQVTNSILGAKAVWPRSIQERVKYRAPLLAISTIAKTGDEALALQGARTLDPAYNGHSVTRAGIEALKKVLRGQESGDPEIRDLFCLDRKNTPEPRAGFDPFRGIPLPK